MPYTDEELSNAVKIKEVHIKELNNAINTIAANAKKSGAIDATGISYANVNSINIKLLQNAINSLEENFSGNCCEANCCQTCQTCQACQGCQSCQGCQTCQGSQSCQGCQKCQLIYEGNCNCNCDCGDDSG